MVLSRKKIFLITSALLIAVPLYLIILWIRACQVETVYPKNVELYNSYLPSFLRGRYLSSLVGFLLSSLAALFSIMSLDKTKMLNVFAIVILCVAALLAFANLWSMM